MLGNRFDQRVSVFRSLTTLHGQSAIGGGFESQVLGAHSPDLGDPPCERFSHRFQVAERRLPYLLSLGLGPLVVRARMFPGVDLLSGCFGLGLRAAV